jgi:hypothetical protein
MGFWDKSDGASAVSGETEFDGGGANFDPIPDGSSVLAYVEEAKWDENRDGARYLNIKWRVEKPEEFLNRVVFQKLWILDDDPNVTDAVKMDKKRDKAKLMLAAIDANAGGKLSRKPGIPTNDDLALALNTKQMVIRLQVWSMKGADGSDNTGNWIAAISPKDKELRVGDRPASSPAKATGVDALDDDIPF